MFKNIIAPVQAWLLSRGQCVGCGTALRYGKLFQSKKGLTKVTCKCGRIFIFNAQKKTYRRALLDEV